MRTIEAGLDSVSPAMPVRFREKMGFLKLKISPGLLNQINHTKKNIEGTYFLFSIIPSIGMGVWLYNSVMASLYSSADIFDYMLACTLGAVCSIMVLGLTNILFQEFPLHREIKQFKEAGWDAPMLGACRRITKLGMTLPPSLLSLVPLMEQGKVSPIVMSILGEQDALAMFLLTETLEKVADDAERAIQKHVVVEQLTLRGESAELLYRVGEAMHTDDEERSKISFQI